MTPLAGAATDTGLLREHNEDRYWMDAERGVFLVVDGVGGQAAGELAAQTAVETIRETMLCGRRSRRRARASGHHRGQQPHLSSALQEGAENARDGLRTDPRAGGGRPASLSATWAIRAYTCFGTAPFASLLPTIRRWAKTRTPAQLTEQEAMQHPRRNEVFRDVGSRLRDADDEGFIEIRQCRFREDAALLLCSDGLTDQLTVGADPRDYAERYDGDPGRVARRPGGGRQRCRREGQYHGTVRGRAEVSRTATAPPRRALAATTRQRAADSPVQPDALAFLTYGVLLGMLLWAVLREGMTRPRQLASAATKLSAGSAGA